MRLCKLHLGSSSVGLFSKGPEAPWLLVAARTLGRLTCGTAVSLSFPASSYEVPSKFCQEQGPLKIKSDELPFEVATSLENPGMSSHAACNQANPLNDDFSRT